MMTRIEFWKVKDNKFLVVDFIDDHEESEEHDDLGCVEYEYISKKYMFFPDDGNGFTYDQLKPIRDKLKELDTQVKINKKW